jgi:hypothetical protein
MNAKPAILNEEENNTQITATKSNNDNINMKQILQDYIDGTNKFQYEYFLNFLKQKQTDELFLISILGKLRQQVHLLDPKLFETSLVNLLFNDIKWALLHSRNSQLLVSLSEFLIDLNSAYTSYISKCFNMLIRIFLISESGKCCLSS